MLWRDIIKNRFRGAESALLTTRLCAHADTSVLQPVDALPAVLCMLTALLAACFVCLTGLRLPRWYMQALR
jgi:hypothetical protein